MTFLACCLLLGCPSASDTSSSKSQTPKENTRSTAQDSQTTQQTPTNANPKKSSTTETSPPPTSPLDKAQQALRSGVRDDAMNGRRMGFRD
ncbi:MAG: hypothetical protein AAFP69_23485 [Planctomycetota bacterium]